MDVNDKVLKVVGSTVLLGIVHDTKMIDGWCHVKVEWRDCHSLRVVRESIESMKTSQKKECDPFNDWIRHDYLVKFNPHELFDGLCDLFTMSKQGPSLSRK